MPVQALRYLEIHNGFKNSSWDKSLFRHLTQFFLFAGYRNHLIDVLDASAGAEPSRHLTHQWLRVKQKFGLHPDQWEEMGARTGSGARLSDVLAHANERSEPPAVVGEPLLHPVAVISVLVLLLNDHWLKSRFPGAVTGKLSDFSGLAFFPLLLWTFCDVTVRLAKGRSGLSHRALVACVSVTGLVFVAVKTTVAGAEAFRWAWAVLQWPARAVFAGHVVPLARVHLVSDVTDLMALPMLLVSYLTGRRSASFRG